MIQLRHLALPLSGIAAAGLATPPGAAITTTSAGPNVDRTYLAPVPSDRRIPTDAATARLRLHPPYGG
jgi:hypothetical protein